MQIPNKEKRLDFFKSLYERARALHLDVLDAMDKSYAQYKGEFYPESKTRDSAAEGIVRNITYELIEAQVSTRIPSPEVTGGSHLPSDEKNAARLRALLKGMRASLPFDRLNDLDERYTYIYGGSVLLAEWDSSLRGDRGGIRVSSVDPRDFIPQPGIYSLDDMEYCFISLKSPCEAVARRWGVPYESLALGGGAGSDAGAGLASGAGSYSGTGSYSGASSYSGAGSDAGTGGFIGRGAALGSGMALEGEETAEVKICFYKNEKGLVSLYAFTDGLTLADIDDYYARKRCICQNCGSELSECSCLEKGVKPIPVSVSEDFELTERDIITQGGLFIKKGTRLPRYRPSSFPVIIRKNTSCPDGVFGQSDCKFIAPQQREINRILTRVHEKLVMAGVYPYKPDGSAFRYDNSIGGKVLNLTPADNPDSFGVLDTTPDISRDLEYVNMLYEDAKRILGISDTYQGINDSTATSGKAKEIQISQSKNRLDSKRAMKDALYSQLDKTVFALLLAFADAPIPLPAQDDCKCTAPTGQNSDAGAFSRYDFLKYDGEQGGYFYDDGYIFGAYKGSDADNAEAWERNLSAFKAGVFGLAEERETLVRYWQAQKRAGYPGAQEILSSLEE